MGFKGIPHNIQNFEFLLLFVKLLLRGLSWVVRFDVEN